MKTIELINAAPSYERLDYYEHSFVRFTMPRLTPEQSEAYNEGRRNGVIAGVVLGSMSAAIMAVLAWLLLM
jgi:hypothetical protein